MKIIEPKVELWQQGDDSKAHVARCARVCYGRETGNDEATIKRLINDEHWSMFRHETYYIIANDSDKTLETIVINYANTIGFSYRYEKHVYYITVNGNWVLDHKTQISTSRELNRVSPNSIAEKSTRYVYEDGTICRPHWMSDEIATHFNEEPLFADWIDDNIEHQKAYHYISSCNDSFFTYKALIDEFGMHRQDARGVFLLILLLDVSIHIPQKNGLI